MSAPSSGTRDFGGTAGWWKNQVRPGGLRVLSATAIAMVEEEMAATGWAGWAVRLFSLALLADTPVFSSEIDAP